MEKGKIYNEMDIEELLLKKSYDELTQEEVRFVNTQVDSVEEYKELRNILLSIKQYSKEQESIVVPHSIKAELMELMEKKKKPFGIFSLNGLLKWLFPIDTPLFRKPGVQFASIVLALLLVLNIGFDFVSNKVGKLAINTTKNNELIIPKTEEVKVEKKEMLEKTEILEPPVLPENIMEPELMEVIDNEEGANAIDNLKPLASMDVSQEKDGIVESEDNINIGEVLEVVENERLDGIKKQKSVNNSVELSSQSLKSSEEVIGLLFVTM